MRLEGGLGRRSLKFGIIGFATSWIGIGLIFDIISLISGFSALCIRDQAKGRAIAGMIFSAAGIALFVVVMKAMFG